jgi:serine/threonine protein phosphatase PrpC
MTGSTLARCSACDAPLQAGDRFCEQCGARLEGDDPTPNGCQVCGGPQSAIGDDGYCTLCGARARAAEDRFELDLASVAAVSDRGRVHRRNEDAVQVRVDESRVTIVVCDGISSASAGDVAARRASQAAVRSLAEGIAATAPDLAMAMGEAIAAARAAVGEVTWTSRTGRGIPSCTLVAAASRDGEIVVGSVGDSRAYWLDAGGCRRLTVDDSWAEEQIAEGRMTEQEAQRDPRSHSITNWIGADAPDRPPRIELLNTERSGRLLLCTDGLWNYLAGADELAELVAALPEGASPAAVARALTETALMRGGRDNITVAVADLDPS